MTKITITDDTGVYTLHRDANLKACQDFIAKKYDLLGVVESEHVITIQARVPERGIVLFDIEDEETDR
jgi:hypothetical protein